MKFLIVFLLMGLLDSNEVIATLSAKTLQDLSINSENISHLIPGMTRLDSFEIKQKNCHYLKLITSTVITLDKKSFFVFVDERYSFTKGNARSCNADGNSRLIREFPMPDFINGPAESVEQIIKRRFEQGLSLIDNSIVNASEDKLVLTSEGYIPGNHYKLELEFDYRSSFFFAHHNEELSFLANSGSFSIKSSSQRLEDVDPSSLNLSGVETVEYNYSFEKELDAMFDME